MSSILITAKQPVSQSPCHPERSRFSPGSSYLTDWQKESLYAGTGDWVFPSYRVKGKQPRMANMLIEDHLRPAVVATGVLGASEDVRFGFHTLRHSLATYLVNAGKDPKTVQGLLRHADVTTMLGIYAHSKNKARLDAQGDMIAAFFAAANNPLSATRN